MNALLTLEELYDRSHAVMLREGWYAPGDDHPISVGILARPTRLFAAGDVVFDYFTNGSGERWSFIGWSSKRRSAIVRHYLQYARYRSSEADRQEAREWREKHSHLRHEVSDWWWRPTSEQVTNRSTVRLVFRRDLPEPQRSWSDPDVRRFALSALRAAYSASPVSTTSGGPTIESERS